MNPLRRYGRWLKRILIVLGVYLTIAFVLLGVGPTQALSDPASTLAEQRGFIVNIIFLFFVIIIQFVGMFWYLTRGTAYTIYPNEYDKTFDDVRGQPAAVEATSSVVRLFHGFRSFRKMGGYPPHGILFEGPPGTGKTLMAKAIAGATGVPFLYADGTRLQSAIFFIGAMKIRSLFKKARAMSDKYGGAVIFIDEIDAIGGGRGAVSERSAPYPREAMEPHRIFMGAGMGGGGGFGVVNELLVQLDGFVFPKGLWRHVKRVLFRSKPKLPHYNILVIAATNRAVTLDPALLRPGRFDRKIHVGLPDAEGRADIAGYYLAQVRHEPIDVDRLARMTVGYSPAMIMNIVNEALIFALQDGRDALRWDDLWQAKLTEEIGLKQPVKYSERERIMVATHEAAHAVASYSLERGELQIQVITIQKREGALGLVHGQEVEEMFLRTQKQLIARIQVALAGLVAEEIWFGQTTSGPSSDLVNATRNAAAYVGMFGMGKSLVSAAAVQPTMVDGDPIRMVLGDPERKTELTALLDDCRRQVRQLLQRKRHVVEGIRDALLEREEIIGDEIEVLMAELGEREPLPVPVELSGNGKGQEQVPVGLEADAEIPPRPDVS